MEGCFTKGLSSKRKRHVLVVEDDLELSAVIDRVIQSIDPSITVDWVTSAEQAVALIKDRLESHQGDRPYDLILTDIFLDGNQSGLDLWKICQQQLPRTPMIVTSAVSADRFFTMLGQDAISPSFLPKPFLITECQQMFEGMLRQ